MTAYVLDCSVAATWIFPEEAAQDTDALFHLAARDGAAIPNLFTLELANLLLVSERKGRITINTMVQSVALITALSLETDSHTANHATSKTLELARTHQLTSYDAAYLELALRLKLPLATRDKALIAAGRAEGVKILP